jgi:hypothetical protein
VSFQPTPKQALVLWKLLITREEPAQSKIKPELKSAERKSLVSAGLITLKKRDRAEHIILTDKAWDWAVEHFQVAFPKKATSAIPVLEALLQLVGDYLQSNQIPLSDFLVTQTKPAGKNLEEKVREAYTRISGGCYNVRVRLSELRQYLSKLSRTEIDETLRSMQRAGKLVLMHLDNPQDIGNKDEQAAIDIGGHKHHIVYMET